MKKIIQNSNSIMWFSNLQWNPTKEWNSRVSKGKFSKKNFFHWTSLPQTQLAVADFLQIFIFELNWAKKWFNSKLNPIYSFQKLFIFPKSKIFNKKKCSFFQSPEYSFKKNIYFFQKRPYRPGLDSCFVKTKIWRMF